MLNQHTYAENITLGGPSAARLCRFSRESWNPFLGKSLRQENCVCTGPQGSAAAGCLPLTRYTHPLRASSYAAPPEGR